MESPLLVGGVRGREYRLEEEFLLSRFLRPRLESDSRREDDDIDREGDREYDLEDLLFESFLDFRAGDLDRDCSFLRALREFDESLFTSLLSSFPLCTLSGVGDTERE